MKKQTKTEEKVKFLDRREALLTLLDSGEDIPLTVTGTSMSPLMKDGRTVVTLSKDYTAKRGRILLFRRLDGSFVLHRVRRILPDGSLVMNGDAQNWCEVIRPSQALAAVTHINNGKKKIRYDSPLLRIWDFLWYFTRPIRPQLFRFFGIFKGCGSL